MKKALTASLAALLLLAAGCGGSSDDKKDAGGDLNKQEKTIAKSLATSFSADSQALTKTEATCFADKFVDTAGVKRLKESKLINAKNELDQQNAKFDKELATDFANSFLGCVSYQKKQAEVIAKANPKIDATKLEACLTKQMPEDYVVKLIVAGYTASADSAQLLQESQKKLETCQKQATAK